MLSDELLGWMRAQGLVGSGFDAVTRLSGGSQNLLYRIDVAGKSYVLRRGPEHQRPGSNGAIRREIRVLQALESSDIPHARLIAGCTDETVLGGPIFYLMEWVEGFNAAMSLPDLHASDRTVRYEMGLRAVDALARLGNVDHVELGLVDFGRPNGFLERQVPRWIEQLESYGRLEGYPGHGFVGIDRIADWLEINRPRGFTPGIVHGDYHLANLIFARQGPDVAAIVDWEMTTVGDPLIDLGLLIATWPDGLQPNAIAGRLGEAGGLPSVEEIVKCYAEHSSRDLSAVRWYEVLACFKFGIVVEGTYARACAGKAPKSTGALLRRIAISMIDKALALVARS